MPKCHKSCAAACWRSHVVSASRIARTRGSNTSGFALGARCSSLAGRRNDDGGCGRSCAPRRQASGSMRRMPGSPTTPSCTAAARSRMPTAYACLQIGADGHEHSGSAPSSLQLQRTAYVCVPRTRARTPSSSASSSVTREASA
ncbi:MAG: hypothetical protein IPJ04_06685 [Candidatus Eisenbacteria bacterium]|nr:hypothetical protein [Candidatus Eisenbacteria bacterium]